jgi:hypothetical protein
MTHATTTDSPLDHYPSPEAAALLSLVSKGEEILTHAEAVNRTAEESLNRLIIELHQAEGDQQQTLGLRFSAVPNVERSHKSTPTAG